jgi:sugar lactone lactonase YvrE
VKHTRLGFRVRTGLAAACIGLLAACGGGGGGGGGGPGPSPAAEIALFAGSLQRAGSRDGAGAAAQFNEPTGVAQDSAGNAYVADTGNHTIRRIAADGTVTTWAGAAGQSGSADGAATSARFSSPRGLAIDAAGSLYVADAGNHTIRRIGPGGAVTTIAGAAGQAGTVDGSAATARFQSPIDVAVDRTGNLYVVAGNAVRKVASDGTVSTFPTVGSIPITAVATDAAGNVFVAEGRPFGSPGAVRKYSAQGQVLPWGPADGGVGVPFPVGLAVDVTGNVYVASSGLQPFSPGISFSSRAILKITPTGQVSTVAGAENDARTTDGPSAVARFRDPRGVSVGGAGGRIVVTETNTSAVRQISAQGVVSTLAGGLGDGFVDGQGGTARFYVPDGLAVGADGTLFVGDVGNHFVRKVSPAGVVSSFAATGSGCQPENLALDLATGTLFIDGSVAPAIRMVCSISPSGAVRSYADSTFAPGGLTVDSVGRVLLGGSSVVRINVDGSKQVVAAGFNNVGAILAAPSGVIYVSDWGDHTVRVIGVDGAVTLLAGQAGQAGHADGLGAQAQLDYPLALALDDAGNLYVADVTTIRRITPQGEVRTIVGVAGQSGVQPGPALAPLGRAAGLAWSFGALYATVQNAVIRIAPVN